MAAAKKHRRAVGIVRVSQVGGGEGESFASPREQRDRITAACRRDGLRLVKGFGEDGIVAELDVSGGTPLEQRPGLRLAVEAVEAGRADVIVAAYFDRLVRSLRVQDELVSRVERAGGQVLAVDVGRVTSGSAGQWLSGTMLGAVSEYQRRAVAERSAEAQARAVARGVVPWPKTPPGYRRTKDGRLSPDPKSAPVVAEAFRMRADGATIAEVRRFLRGRGIERSYHGVQSMLGSRVVLGELHFGDLVNRSAHPAIVDLEVWRAVQRVKVSRGRRPKSEQLLARLGVLRCGSCGSRMVVGSSHHGEYRLYRCPPVGDCDRRVTISASLAEQAVVDAVRDALADLEGRASAEGAALTAEATFDQAQAALDAAIRTLAGFEDEPAARQRLEELRVARDEARDRLAALGSTRAAISLRPSSDWDRLSTDARRALIKAVVDRAVVAPGRGPDRVRVYLVGE